MKISPQTSKVVHKKGSHGSTAVSRTLEDFSSSNTATCKRLTGHARAQASFLSWVGGGRRGNSVRGNLGEEAGWCQGLWEGLTTGTLHLQKVLDWLQGGCPRRGRGHGYQCLPSLLGQARGPVTPCICSSLSFCFLCVDLPVNSLPPPPPPHLYLSLYYLFYFYF